MQINKDKILVTGAEGFIGSHLVEELVRSGCNVRAFVLYNSFNSWGWLDHLEPGIQKELEIHVGDVRDPKSVRNAVKGCRLIFHLAALIAIPYSYHSPSSYIDTNVKGTLNILEAAREFAVEKLVHTSTSEVYGTVRFVPITEEHPIEGKSPYAASKIGADQIAASYYYSFETPVAIARPFNTYGPRQSARAVIPTIITQILSGVKAIKLGALRPTRDFNFIKDTVSGLIAVGTSDRSIGEVINIGSNFEISIKDTVELIANVIGAQVEINRDPNRIRPAKSEVERLWADNTKARQLLGWEPLYGGSDGFKRGLVETVDWFADPENLKLYKWDIFNV